MGLFNFLIYIKFRNKKWKRLSPTKRLKLFQKLENIISKKEKRPKLTIVPKDWGEDTNGLCDYNKKTIYINSKFFMQDEMQFMGLATLFHEQRHAKQFYIISTKKKFFKFSKSYRWKKNMEGYINYDGHEKYSYYSMQEVERDANKFAIQYLKKFKFWFNKEPLYREALEIKIKQFDDTKEFAKKELGVFYKLKLFFRGRKERKRNK